MDILQKRHRIINYNIIYLSISLYYSPSILNRKSISGFSRRFSAER